MRRLFQYLYNSFKKYSSCETVPLNVLRVADASIFPLIPSANINTPTVMVAERAAHFILHPEEEI